MAVLDPDASRQPNLAKVMKPSTPLVA